MSKLDSAQKIFLFLFILNIFLGPQIYQSLGLIDLMGTSIYGFDFVDWSLFFSIEDNFFWWLVNFVLVLGYFIFRKNGKKNNNTQN